MKKVWLPENLEKHWNPEEFVDKENPLIFFDFDEVAFVQGPYKKRFQVQLKSGAEFSLHGYTLEQIQFIFNKGKALLPIDKEELRRDCENLIFNTFSRSPIKVEKVKPAKFNKIDKSLRIVFDSKEDEVSVLGFREYASVGEEVKVCLAEKYEGLEVDVSLSSFLIFFTEAGRKIDYKEENLKF